MKGQGERYADYINLVMTQAYVNQNIICYPINMDSYYVANQKQFLKDCCPPFIGKNDDVPKS
jgi:hypothetical protein